MSDVLTNLRAACAEVADRSRYVRVNREAIGDYAASLPPESQTVPPDPDVHITSGSREDLAAFWITLDAINFGSGWFPTLHKREGRSGYLTIAAGLRDRFARTGPWTTEELARITAAEIADTLNQSPDHELIGLFARSLRDLGRQITDRHGGSFEAVVDSARRSAVSLVERLSDWECFRDVSTYDALEVPFLKRAQITAADLHRVGVVELTDLDRLTMFADNLVPHVLRLDGILHFDRDLVRRIERQDLLEHGSPEEVEIRACAVHAVELLSSAAARRAAADVDQLLWLRGQGARYKAAPRHRCRCSAY